jgi:capsid assembly protease
MKYPHLLQAFFSTYWAILPEKYHELRSLLVLKNNGDNVDAEQIGTVRSAREQREQSLLAIVSAASPGAQRQGDGVIIAGRTGILPVFGVIAQRVSALEMASGGISTEQIGASLQALIDDDAIDQVAMVFVAGLQELADRVFQSRQQKQIVALADSMAASAGYWLASQAAELCVSPGGQVGSIGVIMTHSDESEALKKLGIKPTLIVSSDAEFKSDGYPEIPLSPDARENLQRNCDAFHDLFANSVARGRGVSRGLVNSAFGKGRMKLAQDAVTSGMADSITTLQKLVTRLNTPGSSGRARSQQAKARARVVQVSEAYGQSTRMDNSAADEAVRRARAHVQRQRTSADDRAVQQARDQVRRRQQRAR